MDAVIAAFRSTLIFELQAVEDFTTKAAARTWIAAWVDEYNTKWRHSLIGMIPPVDYELTQPANSTPEAA